MLTTYYTSNQQPQRSHNSNGHPLLSAPYGIYKTSDGYIALAMMDISALAKAIECPLLEEYSNERAFADRDEIKAILAEYLSFEKTDHWLTRLQEQGLWAMDVFDWEKMMDHEAYQVLQMEQTLNVAGKKIVTTRCPIRFNGERIHSDKPAPGLGEDKEKVMREIVSS